MPEKPDTIPPRPTGPVNDVGIVYHLDQATTVKIIEREHQHQERLEGFLTERLKLVLTTIVLVSCLLVLGGTVVILGLQGFKRAPDFGNVFLGILIALGSLGFCKSCWWIAAHWKSPFGEICVRFGKAKNMQTETNVDTQVEKMADTDTEKKVTPANGPTIK